MTKRKGKTADKGTRGTSGGKTRRRSEAVGRIARPRETSEYRSVALDEHSVQVREQIDVALSEALRLREDITQRIDAGVYAAPEVSKVPDTSFGRPLGSLGRLTARRGPRG